MSSAALLVTGRAGKAATWFWARSGELARVSVNTCSHKMTPLRPIVLDALEFVPNPRLLTEADAAPPSLSGHACPRFDVAGPAGVACDVEGVELRFQIIAGSNPCDVGLRAPLEAPGSS